ncbi:MAG: Gfo/Idh/MocA family oxidoreductase [Planctomycetes bacterium]|nr:Gfo/Idh/MocA family oxidoreductase [Planctomycetota bacterium]
MSPPADPPATSLRRRVGIVGAGRSRQGLGPFLARAFAAEGWRVSGVSGRDSAGAERAASELAGGLGQPVAAFASARELAATVDLLVVAAPVEAHLAGLDAALAAGVPCLCEKPLVAAVERDAGLQRVAEFARRGLALFENCQWPFVLPALLALHPGLVGAPVRSLAMGLSPALPGRAMVADSLSHLLSVLQALVPLPPDTMPSSVRQRDRDPAAVQNEVAFAVRGAAGPVEVSLHLQVVPSQPRPAWLAVNGCRIDRRIGAGYAISFATPDGRSMNVRDPLQELVYRVGQSLLPGPRERTEAPADLALRIRLYAAILQALG